MKNYKEELGKIEKKNKFNNKNKIMGFYMKRGNKNVSYQDIMSEPNQELAGATEGQRNASIEEEKTDTPLDKKAPTKMWGKIIDTAVGALKEDTAAVERAYNNRISAASIQRK
jgi:hypothetical protein